MDRLQRLEEAILSSGGITKLIEAPRHELTEEEYKRVKNAVNSLCRDTNERQFLDADIGALIGRSLVKQGVLPVFSEAISFGFDPNAQWPVCGYLPPARNYLTHMFCKDAVVAFFLVDQQTGMIYEAYRVAGDLTDFGAPPYSGDAPMWGRIRY
jgi:hypothetical protein